MAILDETANNNDGSYSGVLYQQTGRVGYGLGLDGADDSVNCGTGASLNVVDAITIAAWVKTPGGSDRDSIVNKMSVAEHWSKGYYLAFEGGGLRMVLNDKRSDSTAITLRDNGWHFIAGTWEKGGTIDLFADGAETGYALQQTQANSLVASTDSLYLGRYYGGNEYLGGIIDEVIIWDKKLTPAEIATYNDWNYLY
ncbi:MAG: LamG domain-containing protein [Candidatus Omnitrophica bacterium]|nr:LamG domain-containing protein [Candidatus Omnitrophota bacterium]